MASGSVTLLIVRLIDGEVGRDLRTSRLRQAGVLGEVTSTRDKSADGFLMVRIRMQRYQEV
jgi:hypothetical protein